MIWGSSQKGLRYTCCLNSPLTDVCVPGVGVPLVCICVVLWCSNGVQVLGVGFGVVVVSSPPPTGLRLTFDFQFPFDRVRYSEVLLLLYVRF